MNLSFTTQRALRAAFWQAHPYLDCRRSRPFGVAGGVMHCTDTRLAWIGWIERLRRDGHISEELGQRASLDRNRRRWR